VALPTFFIIGAPKAGTTALYAALLTHPQLYLSPVKEPKFFLCNGRRPRPPAGPGDAHSTQEWMWRRSDYEALFQNAPKGTVAGEATPFYLYDRGAHRRLWELVPDARLIAVVRDPVDRAYSNWLHLWSDGLEPISDFVAEDERIAAGWALFWHYRRLGLYGEQLDDLLTVFPREQVHVLRYRELVDTPREALDRISVFLGVAPGVATLPPPENVRGYVRPSPRQRALSKLMRGSAAIGALFPPKLWRKANLPLLWALYRDAGPRPQLTIDVRRRLVTFYADDVRRLERVTGDRYDEWLGDQGRGEFSTRRAGAAW
jgi:sulfotransferase family protein